MSGFQTRPVYFHTGDLQHFLCCAAGRSTTYRIVVALVVRLVFVQPGSAHFFPSHLLHSLPDYFAILPFCPSALLPSYPDLARRSVATVCGLGRAGTDSGAGVGHCRQKTAAPRGSSAIIITRAEPRFLSQPCPDTTLQLSLSSFGRPSTNAPGSSSSSQGEQKHNARHHILQPLRRPPATGA